MVYVVFALILVIVAVLAFIGSRFAQESEDRNIALGIGGVAGAVSVILIIHHRVRQLKGLPGSLGYFQSTHSVPFVCT